MSTNQHYVQQPVYVLTSHVQKLVDPDAVEDDLGYIPTGICHAVRSEHGEIGYHTACGLTISSIGGKHLRDLSWSDPRIADQHRCKACDVDVVEAQNSD